MITQTNMFDILNMRYRINKPIRLIELFSGIGAQAKALENINANYDLKILEVEK